MKFIVLRRVAKDEFEDAIDFYNEQREGLGQEFQAIIEEYFHRIAEEPSQFPKIRGKVQRAVVLRRFPFVIHFLVESRRIVILSVFHASRDPKQLKYRH